MISSRIHLKKILKLEFNHYFPNKKIFLKALLLQQNHFYIWRYQKYLRKLEYHQSSTRTTKLKDSYHKIMFAIYSILVNRLGRKLGLDMWHSCFKEGLIIYHSTGGIIVNSKARIGKNCHLHGNNCIGNNGKNTGAPAIGDNCIMGIGAKIIGDIILGNNITVAAGAVVLTSCLEDNVVLAGVPATIKKRKTLETIS